MSAIPKKTRRKPEGKDSPSNPSAVPTGKQDFCTMARCGKKQKTCFFGFMQISNLHFVSLSKNIIYHCVTMFYKIYYL